MEARGALMYETSSYGHMGVYNEKITCKWPTTPLYQAYHDRSGADQFMMIGFNLNIFVLEACGLSWLTILNKRDIIRAALML